MRVGSPCMNDKELYARILGIERPWIVSEVKLDMKAREVVVCVAVDPSTRLLCSTCGKVAPGYDSRRRRWRHLDTCQLRTILEADVPRVECPTDGIQQISVPWSEPHSRFTALFESLVIDWLRVAPIKSVADLLDMSWDEVDTILQRAVKRGLARRKLEVPARIGVDETSFQKRHEYVTIVTALDGEPRVLHVADDRRTESLDSFYSQLSKAQLEGIEVVAMDMHRPYINATRNRLEAADDKIAFDRFHVAKHLNDAVNITRRQENKALLEQGDQTLVGTRYWWLQRAGLEPIADSIEGFQDFAKGILKTARAWAIKEAAAMLWSFRHRKTALRAWKRWLAWAMRSRLEPIRRAAMLIKEHLAGIVTAIVTRTTNAAAEGINSRIQWIKKMACGFRNRDRFRNAIYFHLGGLDLHPQLSNVTHTDS
jgi:transposase